MNGFDSLDRMADDTQDAPDHAPNNVQKRVDHAVEKSGDVFPHSRQHADGDRRIGPCDADHLPDPGPGHTDDVRYPGPEDAHDVGYPHPRVTEPLAWDPPAAVLVAVVSGLGAIVVAEVPLLRTLIVALVFLAKTAFGPIGGAFFEAHRASITLQRDRRARYANRPLSPRDASFPVTGRTSFPLRRRDSNS